MKTAEVVVGGRYYARVSDSVVVVEVREIRRVFRGFPKARESTNFECLNLTTGRMITVKSATRFRAPAES